MALFLLLIMGFDHSFETEDCSHSYTDLLKGCQFKMSTSFPCDIHGYYYECTGAPTHLFNMIRHIASILCGVYIICCIMDLNWLKPASLQFCDCDKPFLRLLIDQLKKKGNQKHPQDKTSFIEKQNRTKRILGHLENLNKDAQLFIDLLASTSGTDQAIFCLARLDSVRSNQIDYPLCYSFLEFQKCPLS